LVSEELRADPLARDYIRALCKTWPAWRWETTPGNAKRVSDSRGVACTGSHGGLRRGSKELANLRDYLHGLRGQTRMSVYKETGAGYLARTKDLTCWDG